MAAIKLPYQIQSNGDWGIVLANQVYGGVHFKESHEDMEAISINLKQPGMLCYVLADTPKKEGGESKPMMYQWDGEQWVEFGKALKINGGIMCAKMEELKEFNEEGYDGYNPDLYDTESMRNGNLIYVEDTPEGGTYMQCVVRYDVEGNASDITYVTSINGFDPLYRCTEPVPENERNVGVGNLTAGRYTRTELEGMTVDRILSYVMFKELPPFMTPGTLSIQQPPIADTGSPLSHKNFTNISHGSMTCGYFDVDGRRVQKVLAYGDARIQDIVTASDTVSFGTPATNKGTLTLPYSGEEATLLTSWGNETWFDDEGVEQGPMLLNGDTVKTLTASATVEGVYYWNFAYGPTENKPCNADDDLAAFGQGGVASMKKDSTLYIRSTSMQVTIGDFTKPQGAKKSTAFIYVLLPDALKITGGKIINGASGQPQDMPSSWIKKRASYKSTTISQYYGHTLWQVAKSGDNVSSDGKVTVTDNMEAIRLTIALA